VLLLQMVDARVQLMTRLCLVLCCLPCCAVCLFRPAAQQ
jgi:hypothetical protein